MRSSRYYSMSSITPNNDSCNESEESLETCLTMEAFICSSNPRSQLQPEIHLTLCSPPGSILSRVGTDPDFGLLIQQDKFLSRLLIMRKTIKKKLRKLEKRINTERRVLKMLNTDDDGNPKYDFLVKKV